jgi:hypothetical protein
VAQCEEMLQAEAEAEEAVPALVGALQSANPVSPRLTVL